MILYYVGFPGKQNLGQNLGCRKPGSAYRNNAYEKVNKIEVNKKMS